MSIAVKCDRCGKLYEVYNTENSDLRINGLATLNIDKNRSRFTHGPYDLFQKCSGEFMRWFKKKAEVIEHKRVVVDKE